MEVIQRSQSSRTGTVTHPVWEITMVLSKIQRAMATARRAKSMARPETLVVSGVALGEAAAGALDIGALRGSGDWTTGTRSRSGVECGMKRYSSMLHTCGIIGAYQIFPHTPNGPESPKH